ncbi:hypothetical protein M3J09_010916 [Ascochyta lentis]
MDPTSWSPGGKTFISNSHVNLQTIHVGIHEYFCSYKLHILTRLLQALLADGKQPDYRQQTLLSSLIPMVSSSFVDILPTPVYTASKFPGGNPPRFLSSQAFLQSVCFSLLCMSAKRGIVYPFSEQTQTDFIHIGACLQPQKHIASAVTDPQQWLHGA